MPLSRDDIRALLYSQGQDSRFTQDSPVLPDVWMEYAENPAAAVDLLLTPNQERNSTSLSPSWLASKLTEMLRADSGQSKQLKRASRHHHEIAVNQTTVAVRLTFKELVRVVLPLSSWWHSRVARARHSEVLTMKARRAMEMMKTAAGRKWLAGVFAKSTNGHPEEMTQDIYWLMLVLGVISLSQRVDVESKRRGQRKSDVWPIPDKVAARQKYFERLFASQTELFSGVDLTASGPPLVHLVSRNRPAMTCLHRSVPAVKADAAVNLFKIDCSDITWAIADSGVDARHPAFQRRNQLTGRADSNPKTEWSSASRVTATYDFTIIRRMLSTSDDDVRSLPDKLKRILKRDPAKRKEIRERLMGGREIDWPLLLPFISVPHDKTYSPPVHDHGTHVAGIVGADWRKEEDSEGRLDAPLCGVCPTINLIDLRILNDAGMGDEFSVMAALQFLRYLNSHKDFMVIHGVNLSLSIRHDVANYACGRTPICEECDRLVASGMVVVAAAGNEGFAKESKFATGGEYQTVSITDPGNADSVITVGSTHRDMPHTYGVSYFSSRGPTGDGRLKPDLVAPGEKIDSVAPGNGLVRKDGTSMAAPHVSGAAALLLARHREFIGQPQRVKKVLCGSATDLGRERYFQGNGMLDVLRALQDV